MIQRLDLRLIKVASQKCRSHICGAPLHTPDHCLPMCVTIFCFFTILSQRVNVTIIVTCSPHVNMLIWHFLFLAYIPLHHRHPCTQFHLHASHNLRIFLPQEICILLLVVAKSSMGSDDVFFLHFYCILGLDKPDNTIPQPKVARVLH